MRNSDQMTIGKTHPTLKFYRRLADFNGIFENQPKQSSSSRKSLIPFTRGATTKISEEHKVLLGEYFSHDPNPSLELREEICDKTGLSSQQIYMWFYLERKRNGIDTVSPRKTVKISSQAEKRLVSKFDPRVKLKKRTK